MGFFKKIVKHSTSKKVLWIVVLIFIIATVAMFTFAYNGIDISILDNAYGWISKALFFELLFYSGKATLEKTKFVDSTIDALKASTGLSGVMEDVASEMNTKNG